MPPRDAPERRTFNLDMVESGWGALFLIYPSLPRNDDLNLAFSSDGAGFVTGQRIIVDGGRSLVI